MDDLDSMLDDCLDEMGEDLAAARQREQEEEEKRAREREAQEEQRREVERQQLLLLQQHRQRQESAKSSKGRGSKAAKAKASSEYGPSSSRKGQAGQDQLDAFVAVPADRRAVWAKAVAEDVRRQSAMPKQKPFSRAYRAFVSKQENVTVHASSEALRLHGSGDGGEDALPGPAAISAGPAGPAAAAAKKPALRYFQDTLHKSYGAAVIPPPPLSGENQIANAAMDRLKALYLQQIVADAKRSLAGDGDVDLSRFPHLAVQVS